MKSHFLGPELTLCTVSVEWYIPKDMSEIVGRTPPGNRYILWAMTIPWPCDFDYMALVPDCPDRYYNVYLVHSDIRPKRTFSPEAKARIRMRKMQQRIKKREPLFYEEMVNRAIAEKPEYYSADGIRKHDERHRKHLRLLDEKVTGRWRNIYDPGHLDWGEQLMKEYLQIIRRSLF